MFSVDSSGLSKGQRQYSAIQESTGKRIHSSRCLKDMCFGLKSEEPSS